MGKIVKFCSSCEEGFAEKFTFCPDCGQSLQAYEMNPLAAGSAASDAIVAAPIAVEEENFLEVPDAVEQQTASAFDSESSEEQSYDAAPFDDEVVTQPAIAVPTNIFVHKTPIDFDRKPASFEAEHDAYLKDGEFNVTVIEEKNVQQRNRLLLGSTLFMVLFGICLTLYSLFNIPLAVYAIGDANSLAMLIDDVPMDVEEEKQQKKDKDAGGGGGGGRDEQEEVTRGDLADQSKNPTRPPDAKVHRSDNFELKTPPPQTEGNKTFEKKYDRWGDPNGRFVSLSNGTGTGGGQGSGIGTGQGSGRGTGAGSGTGSGYGSGFGTGNGGGTGTGTDGEAPPTRPVGVTQKYKILAKPRADYTNLAREKVVQGTVRLKVVFLASGQIGSISSISGLPYGLTEQAIAAARQIRFEPAKRNGVPVSSSVTLEYGFTIYQ